MAPPLPLSAEQVQQWDESGAVTVDVPGLADDLDLLDALQRSMLHHMPWWHDNAGQPLHHPGRVTNTNAWVDDWPQEDSQPLCDLVQLPFFEEAAKQLLGAQNVYHCAAALAVGYPEANSPRKEVFHANTAANGVGFDQHIDGMYTLEQWEATPRRALVSFFVWLAEATPLRGPLMYRPGSHRVLAARNSATNTDNISRRDETRMFPDLTEIPDSGLGPEQFAEAMPAVGGSGSCTLTTTCLVHGASTNLDTKPRFSAHITYAECGFVKGGYDGVFRFAFPRYWQTLHDRCRPERRHIFCRKEDWADDDNAESSGQRQRLIPRKGGARL